jgi:dihydropteroate synthase
VNVTPLALHSPRAIGDALRSHGWEAALADTAAEGIYSSAFHITGLDQGAIEALVPFAGSLGLEVVTGSDWAIVAGSRSRLSALARPWTVPEPLMQVAVGVGTALPQQRPTAWQTARGSVFLDRPVILGILNVTPDSFSDGGQYTSLSAAMAHAEELLAAGAFILDIGGESTRPGRTEAVPAEEELRRVVPVVAELARRYPELVISIDTVKASVAKAAIEAGAAVVNDVSALRLDPSMAGTVAAANAGIILMHSRGSILELSSYLHTDYAGDVVGGVIAELRDALTTATAAGITPDATVIDPGFGFSKTPEQNLLLFDQLGALQSLDRPILVGPSRKRFVRSATGVRIEDRDRATAAACALAYDRGARLFRVHDVTAARETLALAQAVGST